MEGLKAQQGEEGGGQRGASRVVLAVRDLSQGKRELLENRGELDMDMAVSRADWGRSYNESH